MNHRLSTTDRRFQLYDPQELLYMDSKVASGYVVLLGGYPAAGGEENNQQQPKLDRGALNLAFLALTDGNVVDACFGVKAHTSASDTNRRSDRGLKLARDAKALLQDASQSSDGVREIAVQAYGKAFQVVLQYNSDCKGLNCITRCYKWKPIHRKAEEALNEAFKPLNEAIDAAT